MPPYTRKAPGGGAPEAASPPTVTGSSLPTASDCARAEERTGRARGDERLLRRRGTPRRRDERDRRKRIRDAGRRVARRGRGEPDPGADAHLAARRARSA